MIGIDDKNRRENAIDDAFAEDSLVIKFLLQDNPVSDVPETGADRYAAAVRCDNGMTDMVEPPGLSVFGDDPDVEASTAAFLVRQFIMMKPCVQVLGMNDSFEKAGITVEILFRVAGQLEAVARHISYGLVRIEQDGQFRSELGENLVKLLVLVEQFLFFVHLANHVVEGCSQSPQLVFGIEIDEPFFSRFVGSFFTWEVSLTTGPTIFPVKK